MKSGYILNSKNEKLAAITTASQVMTNKGNLRLVLESINKDIENLKNGIVTPPDDGGGEGEQPGEEGYEQLINYAMAYDSGDKCEEVTGGWDGSYSKYNTAGTSQYSGSVLTEEDECFSGTIENTKALTMKYKSTSDQIDLTNYSRLYGLVEVLSISGTNAMAEIRISDSGDSRNGTNKAVVKNTVGKELKVIDLSTYNDNFNIVASINITGGSSNSSIEAKFHNIFLAKADDYVALCNKADITAPSTLEELLADTTSLATIFNSEEAVKFMCKQCTGDFMAGVLNNETAVGLLKESPYLNMVVANRHWAKFMMIPTANELLGYAMLYDEGVETDNTFGTGYKQNTSSVTKNSDHILLTMTADGNTITTTTANAIDVTEYSKLHAKMKCSGTVTTKPRWVMYVGTGGQNTNSNFAGVAGISSDYGDIVHDGMVELDISSVEGSYYPHIGMTGDSGDKGTMYLYEMFLTKSDNFQKWAELGGITADSLESLVADSAAMATLMSNQKAVEYLAGCTGDLMVAICNSEVAMSALCDNIAYDTLFKHPVWRKFMLMCPTSLEAMKSAPTTASIPTMTSNTEPSGKITYDSYYDSNYIGSNAFDKNETTWWQSASGIALPNRWIQYEFPEEIDLFCYELKVSASNSVSGIGVVIQVSTDGLEYETIATCDSLPTDSNTITTITGVVKDKRIKFIKVAGIGASTIASGMRVREVQAYGKVVE